MRRQRGVVLIVAMLIVALVTTIIVSLSWRYNLSLTRSENRWHGLQAQAYLQGAEALAQAVLVQDAEADQQQGEVTDNLGEMWAQEAQPMPTDHGWVQGNIEDAQGRFNLNSLQQKASALQGNKNPSSVPLNQRFTASQKRFIRLLQTFELEDGPLDQSRAVAITQAVIDWLDVDQQPSGFGGAERDYYQQLEPPTTPPNLPMVSVSELLRIKGMTPELYRALLPLVVVLPIGTQLNINTMPLPLMRTMNGADDLTPLTLEDAQMLMEERSMAQGGQPAGAGNTTGGGGLLQQLGQGMAEVGYDDVAGFKDSPTLSTLAANSGGLDTDQLGVASDYFLLFSRTQVGEQIRDGASLMRRDNNQVRVIRRTDAHF